MKLNVKQFKTLIKECLRELIQEGAFETMLSEAVIPKTHPNVPMPYQPHPGASPHVMNAVHEIVEGMARGNPAMSAMMTEIFADTAATTLPMQNTNDPRLLNRTMGGATQMEMNQFSQGMHMPVPPQMQPQQAYGMHGVPMMKPPGVLREHQSVENPASRWAQIAFAKKR